MESSVWTPERIAEVVSAHGVDRAYRLDLNGADALGFDENEMFTIAAGSRLGPIAANLDRVALRFRGAVVRDGMMSVDGVTLLEDVRYLHPDEAARIASGVPCDECAWKGYTPMIRKASE